MPVSQMPDSKLSVDLSLVELAENPSEYFPDCEPDFFPRGYFDRVPARDGWTLPMKDRISRFQQTLGPGKSRDVFVVEVVGVVLMGSEREASKSRPTTATYSGHVQNGARLSHDEAPARELDQTS
jgi:hypothetical protein